MTVSDARAQDGADSRYEGSGGFMKISSFFAMSLMCFLGSPNSSHARTIQSHDIKLPENEIARLKGVEYVKARKTILARGWKPAPGPCYTNKETCLNYPEIDACSESLPVQCGMLFVDGGRCLAVGTSGESAPGFEKGDPVIDVVRLVNNPCLKNLAH